ncbi:hypothetical protein COY05_03580 [Candidatus Peregrinibacteria bacterium CG_4_10_14_0_2_um_filter_38_24]|nr:MAG: hypothetical protein COY05_03580 [Candidatus Peregrinibacteria bacterium CG_4_10_14_0_2_um_filter_38_24]PJC38725.1 MAG: hypothetical protein CO044_03500 [Candidatus Peregrinibacteria bacterium CG_4_9_14_0_2_um_filter_38_9]
MISKIASHLRDRKIKNAQRREMERNSESSFDSAVLSWTAPEFVKYKRGITWRIVVATVMISLILFGYFYNAWTFSLAVIVFAIVYGVVNRKEPKDVQVVLSEIGIKVGYRKYPYGLIKDFCIVYEPPYTSELHLRVSNDLAHEVVIQLWSQNPAEARNYLLRHLTEKRDHKEALSNALLKLFKL